MRRHAQMCPGSFVDDCANFFFSKQKRRATTRAGRDEYLDDVCTGGDLLTHKDPHRSDARVHVSACAIGGTANQRGTRRQYSRTGNLTAVNSITQSEIRSAARAEIAHCRKTSFEG